MDGFQPKLHPIYQRLYIYLTRFLHLSVSMRKKGDESMNPILIIEDGL